MRNRYIVVPGLLFALLPLAGCDKAGPGGGGSSGNGKASLASLQKLLDEIPKEAQPSADKDGEIERNKANQWLAKNAVGRVIELTGEVRDVAVTPAADRYNVHLTFGRPLKELEDQGLAHTAGLLGKVRSGGASWEVFVNLHYSGGGWEKIGEPAAKRLRGFKGKIVTIRAKTADLLFSLEVSGIQVTHLRVGLKEVTVEGFDPTKD